MTNGSDLLDIENCLITHSHSDHLYERDLAMIAPGFSRVPDGYAFNIYGSEKVCDYMADVVKSIAEKYGIISLNRLDTFTPTKIGGYTVTAPPSVHDPKSGPQFYMIEGEKTVLYAHDTHFFSDEVWEYLKRVKPHFDLVSLDCTNALLTLTYIGHMELEENIKVKEKMLSIGVADEKTVFACNQFSHNGISVSTTISCRSRQKNASSHPATA